MDFAAETIGFLGLGAIGEPIATRLSGGNHKLVVFDVRREAVEPFRKTAEVAASPKAVPASDRADATAAGRSRGSVTVRMPFPPPPATAFTSRG